MPSEIWSANLSGCPELTDSLVNKNLPEATTILLEYQRDASRSPGKGAKVEAAIIGLPRHSLQCSIPGKSVR
jgi:hypothetical protein